jgi:hypothetical protein
MRVPKQDTGTEYLVVATKSPIKRQSEGGILSSFMK